jgi:hypothetical protein
MRWFLIFCLLLSACSATPEEIGHISSLMPNQYGIVEFTAGDTVPLSWICPDEATERVVFTFFGEEGNPIVLGETTELRFYTKCFRDAASLRVTVPMQPAEGYIQGIGYRGGRVTSYSRPLSVKISPAP